MIRRAKRALVGGALAALTLTAPGGAAAESMVAARSIMARTVIDAGDLRMASAAIPGAITQPSDAVGMEALVTIYEGRPVRPGDLGPPTLIERNDIVRLRFAVGAIEITTEGRALDRGALGDRVRVMNLASRAIVTGNVAGAADISVSR